MRFRCFLHPRHRLPSHLSSHHTRLTVNLRVNCTKSTIPRCLSWKYMWTLVSKSVKSAIPRACTRRHGRARSRVSVCRVLYSIYQSSRAYLPLMKLLRSPRSTLMLTNGRLNKAYSTLLSICKRKAFCSFGLSLILIYSVVYTPYLFT